MQDRDGRRVAFELRNRREVRIGGRSGVYRDAQIGCALDDPYLAQRESNDDRQSHGKSEQPPARTPSLGRRGRGSAVGTGLELELKFHGMLRICLSFTAR